MDYGKLASSLSKLLDALEQHDIASLRNLGSALGETALLEGGGPFVEIAVGAYACSKMLEKPHFRNAPAWKKALPKIISAVRQALSAAAQEKLAPASTQISLATLELQKASEAAGRFQMGVLQKARIKLGADIYAHGASLGRACELSGAPKEKLQSYLGNTKLADKYVTIPAKERMRKASALFA